MDGAWALDSSRCLVHLVACMDCGKRSLQSVALNAGNLAEEEYHNLLCSKHPVPRIFK